LTAEEAASRRSAFGLNDILGDRVSGWGAVAHDTARDPMVWFLAATAMLFALLGDYAEAGVLGLALLPIAGMDAYLHRRTQASTEELAGRLATTARVLREGSLAQLAAVDLVPGDLVFVGEGDAFPADGILVVCENSQADESALTGEAMPVRKHAFEGTLAGEQTSVDNDYWGSAGTRLLTGEARLRVVFTGSETLYGEIVRSAREGQHERTPLQTAIGTLVTELVAIALVVCVALGVTRYLQGFGLLDAFLSAVTLAVAALPEEFPVAFTFFLGVGVYRLARRQALVRRAVVVENIGRVTCICSDKTGTLTKGKLTLAHVFPADGVAAAELRRIAAQASRERSGDPLDAGVLAGASLGTETRLATFPFTENRRRETAVLRDGDAVIAAGKGAPETIFAMSRLTPAETAAWLAKTEELGAGGHKVLACARRRLDEWSGSEPTADYRFLGLLAFEDPVREGVRAAVAKAKAAGIRVIMVTGDHVATARAIAREIGLGGDSPRIIEGAAFEPGAARGADGFDVLARAVPAQKLDLVRALRLRGRLSR
jgi:P-type Ca2+ transporter type 2C